MDLLLAAGASSVGRWAFHRVWGVLSTLPSLEAPRTLSTQYKLAPQSLWKPAHFTVASFYPEGLGNPTAAGIVTVPQPYRGYAEM